MKRVNKLGIIEILLGIGLITLGFKVYFWAKSLFWILIYPPPLRKQIIEASPFFLWLIGVFLLADGIRRLVRK